MDEPITWNLPKDRLYVFGPTHHTEMWVERRKWWQFWLPRYVEKYVTWEEWPERDSDTRPKAGDAKQGSTCE